MFVWRNICSIIICCGDPFWLTYLKAMKSPPLPPWAHIHLFYIMYSTGPFLLKHVISQYDKPIIVFPPLIAAPCSAVCADMPCTSDDSYVRMLKGGSWCRLDDRILSTLFCRWKDIIKVALLFLLALIILILITN
jgi:mannosyltransferase OCH1-like enzyme